MYSCLRLSQLEPNEMYVLQCDDIAIQYCFGMHCYAILFVVDICGIVCQIFVPGPRRCILFTRSMALDIFHSSSVKANYTIYVNDILVEYVLHAAVHLELSSVIYHILCGLFAVPKKQVCVCCVCTWS